MDNSIMEVVKAEGRLSEIVDDYFKENITYNEAREILIEEFKDESSLYFLLIDLRVAKLVNEIRS